MLRAGAVESRERIRSVDGLRALAFLLVFAFHSWEFAGKPFVPVISGIVSQNTRPDFFVVLTGFVLFLPFARDPDRARSFAPKSYLKRRMRRIVLPYYAALAFAILLPQTLVILMRILGREASWQEIPSLPDILTHLTFTHLFFPEYWAGINGSLWTMSLEVQLYLVFPVLVLLYERYGNRAIIFALAFSLGYRFVVGLWLAGRGFPVEFLGGATAIGRMMEFIAGMVAAELMFAWRRSISGKRVLILGGVVTGGYIVATSPAASLIFLAVREVFLGVTFGALILLAVTVPFVERAFAWPAIAGLGYRAYSMFLVHQPVAWYFSEMVTKMLGVEDGHVKLAIMWSMGLGAVLVIGQVFFVMIERPCIAWAKATPTDRRPMSGSPAITRE